MTAHLNSSIVYPLKSETAKTLTISKTLTWILMILFFTCICLDFMFYGNTISFELEMSCYLAVIYVNLTGKRHPMDLLNKPLLLLLYYYYYY